MKKLRRNIILGVFLSATVVFALTILFAFIGLNVQVTRRADSITKLLVQNNGVLPAMSEYEKLDDDREFRVYNYSEESPFRLRYFSVFYDQNDIVSCDVTHIAAIDETSAVTMADTVMLNTKTTGNYEKFRYRINDDRSMAVFLDFSEEYKSTEDLTVLLSLIALAFVIMITIVFCYLSNRIVKPFEDNSRMQKQFITDASHELKTPIAIISANAEVLSYKEGDNEWVNNIISQVGRVSGLVNELLTLNRLEEVDELSDIEPVDLSALCADTAATFEEMFKKKNASLCYDIQPGVVINGSVAQLERLVSVLVENASKYVAENGVFRMTLKKELRHTTLTFFNSCEINKDIDYKHLFDRFYRPDTSRDSSTGGHGIGLSIAKRIVTLHDGTIESVPSDEGLTFVVKLSNKMKAGKHSDKD